MSNLVQFILTLFAYCLAILFTNNKDTESLAIVITTVATISLIICIYRLVEET